MTGGRLGRRSLPLGPILMFAAVVVSLAVGAWLIALSGVSPLSAYRALLRGAFGSLNGVAETLVKMTPLLLAGLGIAVALRAGLFNIGAEGQLYMGAVGAAFVGLFLGDVPGRWGVPLALLAGFLMGGAWAAIPAALKLRFGANEIIVTLMMNYVALEVVSFLISGPWKDPGATEPFTAQIAPGVRLPVILAGTRLHAGMLVALAAAGVLWWAQGNTVVGYELAVTGANERAARYGGIQTWRVVLLAMVVGGGLAGLAGVAELAGLHHRLLEGLSPGYGYTAIAIAVLGKGNPLGVLVAAFCFAGLLVGSEGMQRATGVPVSVALILQGTVLLFVLGADFLHRRQTMAAQKWEAVRGLV